MADELVENAEFGKKNKNEEEPILVAQRFLNIYRQMHIFNKERQEQFDNMLLELSPDVRILLSTLPGGSVLLEHIEELEAKRGLVSPVTPKNKTTTKNVQDLTPKNPTTVVNQPAKQAPSNAGIVIDSSFASELSNSLSFALQQTEKRYKEDIKTLTETLTHSIMESQTAIANMMKDILLSTHNRDLKLTLDTPTKQKDVAENVVDNQLGNSTYKSDLKPNIKTEHPINQNNIPTQNSKEDKVKETKTQEINESENSQTLPQIDNEKNKKVKDNETKIKTEETSRQDLDKSKTSLSTNTNTLQKEDNDPNLMEFSVDTDAIKKQVDEKPVKQSKKTENKDKNETSSYPDSASDKVTSNENGSGKALPQAETPRIKKLSELDEVMPFAALDLPNNDTKTSKSKPIDESSLLHDSITDFSIADDDLDLDSELSKIYNDTDTEVLNNNNIPVLTDTLNTEKEEAPDDKATPKILDHEIEQIRHAIKGPSNVVSDNTLSQLSTESFPEHPIDKLDEEFIISPRDFENNKLSEVVSLDDVPDNPISLDYVTDNTQTSESVSKPGNDGPSMLDGEASYGSDDENDDWEWEYVDENGNVADNNDDDWEWEYVDDNGNVTAENSDDWEWEYVDDEGHPVTADEDNNKK